MSIPRKVRIAARYRDRDACVRCGSSVHVKGYSIHHRKPRGMGGTRNLFVNRLANLLTLCGSGTTGCHGWIESHREWARENGYLLHDVADAPNTPVLTYAGWRLFTDNGDVLEVVA